MKQTLMIHQEDCCKWILKLSEALGHKVSLTECVPSKELQMRCEGYCGFSSVLIVHILHLRFLKDTFHDMWWHFMTALTRPNFWFHTPRWLFTAPEKARGAQRHGCFPKGKEGKERRKLITYSNCTSLSFKMWCVLILNTSILRDSWASKWIKHRLQILHFGGSW